MKILLLEDNLQLATDWREAFERKGWETTILRRGSEAKRLVANEKFDVIICDLFIVEGKEIIPDGGLTLISGLRYPRAYNSPDAWQNHVPILVITGAVERSMLQLASQMGATKVIAKPIQPFEVVEEVLSLTLNRQE